MSFIKPFAALRPTPESVADIIAPPYDVLNSEEAKIAAAHKPLSFLHVSKPEIDLADNVDPYSEEVYQKGAENFASLREQGAFEKDASDTFYIYQLQTPLHTQTGIVGLASVEAYRENKVRKHELTRPKKETSDANEKPSPSPEDSEAHILEELIEHTENPAAEKEHVLDHEPDVAFRSCLNSINRFTKSLFKK